MIMSVHNFNIAFAVFGLCLHCVVTNGRSIVIEYHLDRPLNSCPGPIWYYKEIGCTPIFENVTSSCPARYNCDVWETSPKDRCPINDRVYKNGEDIGTEAVKDPCMSCRCRGDEISCLISMCSGRSFDRESNECSVVVPQSWSNGQRGCCDPYEFCGERSIPTNCTYHGITYQYQAAFIPMEDPEKLCICGKGYSGEDHTSSCVARKPSWCNNVLQSMPNVRAHCVPVYAHDKSPRVDCNDALQCPNENENYVIQRPGDSDASTSVASESENADKRCRFGELTMGIGEEFTSSNRGGPFKCVCEIPPVPTCRFSAVTDEST